ncbi:ankyrin repeat domain-containing protein 31 [Chionomys nivalis]|uniref:ankyrin repeat domain-containing protein 31 n=1 Tax=Chionomys nivalis TaxID=269649 RepID=UPI00259444B7|nr:ankyrin repeat domain-containing protein 31 [Chionomys nivalis]
MEKGAQASECDSDETVIEGSVTENELEDEELPWRRLLLNRDTSFKSEFCLHSGENGMWKGMPSPEIQLGLKFLSKKDSEVQKNKNKVMPTLSEDLVLQDPQDEATQNQVLLQTTREFPAFSLPFAHPEFSWSHRKTGGPEVENGENLLHPGKELSENTDSPEISLLSGTSLMASDLVTAKEKSFAKPVKTLAVPNTFFEPEQEVTLTMTSKETKDEESSLETFVSALERLLESPEGTQEETLLEIANDFNPQELKNPLSNSLSSVSVPLNALSACCRDVLENTKNDDALPAELLATINILPGDNVEPGPLGPICQGQEKSSSVSGGNGCLEVQPTMSQIDEDCTQIVQTIEDPKPFKLQTRTHENTSYEQLNDKGNSGTVKNTSVQETPHVLRRSSRLEKLKASRDVAHTDVLKMPESISSKSPSCEDQIHNIFATENFSKRKNMHLSRFKSEQRKKNEQLKIKNGKRKMSKMCPCSINRRNVFGENLLYKAALHNDVDLVRCCIKNGGNVNQPSYAGWTALHEASVGGHYQTVSALLEGGAEVNAKGKYQITPLHDAVMNGHYQVAELLLLNGADPLFKSDHGTCALDEAKDSFMENLLRKYIPKHKNHHLSAQRKSTDPEYVDDIFQYKKPKLSSNNHTEFICSENSNRQEPEHVEINKERNNLLVNKEYVYEHCQKNTIEFGNSKVRSMKDSRTNVSKSKKGKNTQHKKTQADDRDCSLSQGTAISSSRGMDKLVTQQQHTALTLDDLPKESCELSTPALPGLKNGADNNNEACLNSKKPNTSNLDLSDNQEMQFLESIDQTKAVSFSEFSLYKEIKLPHVTADQQPHTNQEQCSSPCKPPENHSSDEKGKNLNEWEDSFLSFIKGRFADSDSDCHNSVKSAASQEECMAVCHNEETTTDGEKMNSRWFLSSENYSLQENELKVGSQTTYPQEKAVNYCDLNDTLIYEQPIPNHKQCTYGISFDHSYAISEHNSTSCTRSPSKEQVSQLTGQVGLLKVFQNNSHSEPTLLVNQVNTYNVEKKQDTERNYTIEGQKPSSSHSPLHTHSQVIEVTKAEERSQDLPENELVNNTDFHSTDNVNKELTNSIHLDQGEEKEIAHKSDEELTTNTSRAERTARNCREEKENVGSATQMPCDTQDHGRDQNFRERKDSLKAPCSQEVNTAGIRKRNAKGESLLHVASRGGDLSLVKVLIASGAEVNLKDNTGWTPLHEASSEGFNDVIIELLKAGANVNCENVDGMLPLHGAAVGNHLKAAETLLEHGANPNQKDQKQRTALEEADDEKMKDLLRSYGAVETSNGDEIGSTAPVKHPALRPKRCKPCPCDDGKTIAPPSPLHEAKRSEDLPAHQTISAILQDIEEKQENLLKLEIRDSEDAEQYIGKMLEIKEVMDDILAQQKTERDDLAKKYRVSMESFKHGALREQLSNLATRQKKLLVVAKKQKKIRLKIQDYKNSKPLSGIRKRTCSSDISSEKSQESPCMKNSVYPQSDLLSPVSLAAISPVDRNMEEIPLSMEMERELSENEMNSKRNVQDCAFGGLLKPRLTDGTERTESSSQPAALVPHAGSSLTETLVKGYGLDGSPAVTGTVGVSEDKSVLSQNDACPLTVPQNLDLSRCNPKRRNKKAASNQPSVGASEPLAHQAVTVLDTDTVQHRNSVLISPSPGSARQQPIKKLPHHSTAPKKKNMQLKDLLVRGRINTGKDILEFKTQETTHRASILPSGKLKVENGQIYQNPVTWLKGLLGGGDYVTWNYAWSKVTYLGKELLKYVSEEEPVPPEPCNTPQQQQPCLPGTSGKSVQSFPHYLQIKEILAISDRELLPSHVMEQHWKFYVECKKLPF